MEINVHVWVESAATHREVVGKLNQILTAVQTLTADAALEVTRMSQLDDKISNLETEVTALTSVNQSVETLLAGLSQQLKDAIAAGGNTDAIAARIQAITDTIDQQKTDLANAVAANTPAE